MSISTCPSTHLSISCYLIGTLHQSLYILVYIYIYIYIYVSPSLPLSFSDPIFLSFSYIYIYIIIYIYIYISICLYTYGLHTVAVGFKTSLIPHRSSLLAHLRSSIVAMSGNSNRMTADTRAGGDRGAGGADDNRGAAGAGGDRGSGGAGGDRGAGGIPHVSPPAVRAHVYVLKGWETGLFIDYTVDVSADATTGGVLSEVLSRHLRRPIPDEHVHANFLFGEHLFEEITPDVQGDISIPESMFRGDDFDAGELIMNRIQRFSPYIVINILDRPQDVWTEGTRP